MPLDDRDRTAYISDVKYGTPSYEAQMNSVDHNFIIANCELRSNLHLDASALPTVDLALT